MKLRLSKLSFTAPGQFCEQTKHKVQFDLNVLKVSPVLLWVQHVAHTPPKKNWQRKKFLAR